MSECKTDNTPYCSFCGKSQNEVKKLIAGPTCFICDECIALGYDIVRESEFMRKYEEGLKKRNLVIIPKKILRDYGVKWPLSKTSLERFYDFMKNNSASDVFVEKETIENVEKEPDL